MESEILIQELARGAEVIRTLVAGVTQAQARFKPTPETWSILEVMCHLYDEEREDFRQHLDVILHHPDMEWPRIDPQGWVTARKYNERDLAETVSAFLAEREESLAWLKRLASPDWEVVRPAPFGSLKAGDMAAAWVAHDTLHTRQLVELRYARLLQLADPYHVDYAGEW